MLKSKRFSKKTELGAAMAEYMLIIGIMAIASIAVFTIFGDSLRALVATSSDQLQGKSGAQLSDHDVGDASVEVKKGLDRF